MAAEPGGAQGAVCFWRPQVEVFLWPCPGSEGPLADGAGLPLMPSPGALVAHSSRVPECHSPGWILSWETPFFRQKEPESLGCERFLCTISRCNSHFIIVTKVPHLHRCPRPRVTSSSHARAALLSGAVRSEGRPLPICPHRGPGLACWLLRQLLWAGWGLLPLCWCGERAWPCV